MAHNIPKIIWQTHNYEFDELPDHFKKTTQTWKNLNPDWDYRYISHIEREKIVKQNPIFWKYYNSQIPACQADMWRYLITYEYGGVYADMDSVCIKPLDYMLDNIDDYDMFVIPHFKWLDFIEYRTNRLKAKGLNDKEIEYHLEAQKSRVGLQVYQIEAVKLLHGFSTNNANYAIKPKSKIMQDIINESEKHLIKMNEKNLSYITLLPPFVTVIQGSKNGTIKPAESVSYEFTSAYHDDPWKTSFHDNFIIDDYGIKMTYKEYIKKYNLTL